MANGDVNNDNVMEEQNSPSSSSSSVVKKKSRSRPEKKEKTGVIYLSSVPEFMSVQRLRNVFSEFGEINRSFFQPIEKSFGYKKGLLFSEGWVEFQKKSEAKFVALALNNSPVGGKKRNPWYSCIWNIKYLPNFTWTDVNAERELQKATHENRIRTEISQAKKQTNFYSGSVDFSKTLDKVKKKKQKEGVPFENRTYTVKQRKTDEEIVAEKKKRKREAMGDGPEEKKSKKKNTFGDNDEDQSRRFVMKNIFGSVL